MSMKLTPVDMRKIADQVEMVAKAGVMVEAFLVRETSHRVLLRWEGPDEPVVVGITQGAFSASGAPLRGDEVVIRTDGGAAAASERVARGGSSTRGGVY